VREITENRTKRPSNRGRPNAGSGDPQQDYFSDGIADDLITGLAKFSGLLVIARNSAFTYKGKSVDERQVGRELGVRYILEGSVRREGERLRVNAQLVDAQSGRPLWRNPTTAGSRTFWRFRTR
jgi:TolB-like protein